MRIKSKGVKPFQRLSYLIALLGALSLFSCNHKVLVRVYGDTEALDPILKEFANVMAVKDQSIRVSSYYEQPDIVIINGFQEWESSIYASNLVKLNLQEKGYSLMQVEDRGQLVLLMVGYDLKGTQAGIQFLTRQVSETGEFRSAVLNDESVIKKPE